MTKDVLLVFLNITPAGSNLVRSLGEQKAREIQNKLESAVLSSVENLPCEKIIFHAGEKISVSNHFKTQQQQGIYLNEKIKNAFNNYILQDNNEVSKVVFITADCPQLTQKIIEKAFESLNKFDVCVGPEKKGTYYLIGMKEPLPFLFSNKLWSGNALLDDTLEELIEHGKNYFLLPELQSVSDIYDLHLVK